MADEDDEGGFCGMYENGHWVWDDEAGRLVYASDLTEAPPEAILVSKKAPTGTIEFRDDIDLIEQIRYRRRYQRKVKPGQPEVITVQDVKDLAIYTAPVHILSPMLINMLHLPTTDRFIRALVLCCQYYLQVEDTMSHRMMELEFKVRTPDCVILENEFRDNLADLRLLLAKEYSTMLIGGGDTRKFHHMGPHKKRRSLSDKDARLFEMLLRICEQIVWLALGRKAFNQIELEVNRMFKSEIFNSAEHMLRTGYLAKMTKEEKAVLLGQCVRYDKKLNTRSPLMNEVFCDREMDYRMIGLGVVNCPGMTPRLQYLMMALSGPEELLEEQGVVLGIIGLPRRGFDTMLLPIAGAPTDKSKSSSMTSAPTSTKSSFAGMKKSEMSTTKLYPDVVIPERSSGDIYYPSSFPRESMEIRPCSEVQRRRWQQRLNRFQKPLGRKAT